MGQGQSSVPMDEARSLVELYEALGGDKWRRREGWAQPTVDPETWFGVVVVRGHVVALELAANELSGELPPTMDRLAHLRVLDLSQNNIRGTRPRRTVAEAQGSD